MESGKSLGALRQDPNALPAYLLAHQPGDRLDYGVCCNWREMTRREIAIDAWQRTNAPECRDQFRRQEARIAHHNRACSHTMAGTL